MVPVSAQSFERTTHNEATDSASLTVGVQGREYKRSYALGEVPVKVLSDGGSTPPISTISSTAILIELRWIFFAAYVILKLVDRDLSNRR